MVLGQGHWIGLADGSVIKVPAWMRVGQLESVLDSRIVELLEKKLYPSQFEGKGPKPGSWLISKYSGLCVFIYLFIFCDT